jgi:SAM-dependent methyltransferase
MAHESRFEANAEGYARFRPRYPDSLIDVVVGLIEGVAAPAGAPVLDVGSGTGIFARQLAERLPADLRVIGVEPARAMREQAFAAGGPPNLAFCDGAAEALPADIAGVRAVTAATAAHWFDAPRFFAEAERVLCPGGVLVIAEYVRAVETSPAARALEQFLAEEGGPKAYVRPDYAEALAGLAGFADPGIWTEDVEYALSVDAYVGLALSSSHARPVVARLGQGAAEEALAAIGRRLADAGGTIAYGYRFQLFWAHRTESG